MKRFRPFLAATAALAAASGIALMPVLVSATPASAATQATCNSTSLVMDDLGYLARVPTVGLDTGNQFCNLAPGNASTAVARLQINLDECNLHADLTVDGIFGPDTEAAVLAVQRHYDTTPDGIFGPVTAGAMYWLDQQGNCEMLPYIS
jgi:peptidoglycan hydrolase-like protein with peptidoglycan-binding domain